MKSDFFQPSFSSVRRSSLKPQTICSTRPAPRTSRSERFLRERRRRKRRELDMAPAAASLPCFTSSPEEAQNTWRERERKRDRENRVMATHTHTHSGVHITKPLHLILNHTQKGFLLHSNTNVCPSKKTKDRDTQAHSFPDCTSGAH